jgi:hypothetical protein
MWFGGPWILTVAAAIVVIAGTSAGIRLAVTADPTRRARAREAVAALAQYGLLFGFAAVAAAISAHGLVGFARSNMDLPGPWPYLLWGALDGAAGLCAVLLMRRAARGESALAARLAVWGLVGASSYFNWTHAPGHPGAREAFALMPVIAATLFEFSLRETRHTARRAERRLTGPGWLRPAERIRVRIQMSADEHISAETAARRVRVERAARCLHLLRLAVAAQERAARLNSLAAYRVRRAERRAQAALTRARFADLSVAAEVLRLVQVLTLTRTLAGLDYTTAEHGQAVLASLITPGPARAPATTAQTNGTSVASQHLYVTANAAFNVYRVATCQNGELSAPVEMTTSDGLAGLAGQVIGYPAPAGRQPPRPGPPSRRIADEDSSLVDVAARIVAEARIAGGHLSQAALARQLRADGYRIANDRLRWLASVSGLEPFAGQP